MVSNYRRHPVRKGTLMARSSHRHLGRKGTLMVSSSLHLHAQTEAPMVSSNRHLRVPAVNGHRNARRPGVPPNLH
jgi:hypothetical protein